MNLNAGRTGSYPVNNPSIREDSDGKQSIYVTAYAGSCTAKIPQVCYISTSGWVAKALYSTGYSSLGVASFTVPFAAKNMIVGCPPDTIPSGSEGWIQIRGPFVSMTMAATASVPTGYAFTWVGAAVSNTSTLSVGAAYGNSTFAICLGSMSSSAIDVYLTGNPCIGIG